MLIHIQRDGQEFGPYTLEDLNKYLAEGSLLASDLAWYEGLQNWIPMEQVPGVNLPSSNFPIAQEVGIAGTTVRSISTKKKIFIGASIGVLVVGVGLAFGFGWIGGGENGPLNRSQNQSDSEAKSVAQESSSEADNISFSKVEPIFRKYRCMECHNSKESNKVEAELDFSFPVSTRAFTSPNQAGNPSTAPLVLAITPGAGRPMPPNGPMISKNEVKVIEEWIAAGAKF